MKAVSKAKKNAATITGRKIITRLLGPDIMLKYSINTSRSKKHLDEQDTSDTARYYRSCVTPRSEGGGGRL
jgi:hypothetical protein